MRALAWITSSFAVIEPSTVPASRATSAVTAPRITLSRPCTRLAQLMSPSTRPSRCRSTVAAMLPVTTTSAPSTEKVDWVPPLAGADIAALPWADPCVGVCLDFENMGLGLQEAARVDGRAAHPHLEMQVGAGRATRRAHPPDLFA